MINADANYSIWIEHRAVSKSLQEVSRNKHQLKCGVSFHSENGHLNMRNLLARYDMGTAELEFLCEGPWLSMPLFKLPRASQY